jgi:hypothetical protein
LEIETDGLNLPETKMAAQKEREPLMKTQFLEFGSFKIGTPLKGPISFWAEPSASRL